MLLLKRGGLPIRINKIISDTDECADDRKTHILLLNQSPTTSSRKQ